MAEPVTEAKNAVVSIREIVQDLLVPELKSMNVSIESLRNEMHIGFEAMRNEMKLRDEKQTLATQALSEKLIYTSDIRERLAVLEDRVPRN